MIFSLEIPVFKKYCAKSVRSEFFGPHFSRIHTEYEEIREDTVQIRENTDKKNFEYRHHFSRIRNLEQSYSA